MFDKFLDKHWRSKLKAPKHNSAAARSYDPPLKRLYLLWFEPILKFWLRNWRVLLPIVVGAIVALFIHFESNANSTTKTEQEKNK